jgi:hypothetical protein
MELDPLTVSREFVTSHDQFYNFLKLSNMTSFADFKFSQAEFKQQRQTEKVPRTLCLASIVQQTDVEWAKNKDIRMRC